VDRPLEYFAAAADAAPRNSVPTIGRFAAKWAMAGHEKN
jgi:hypothetical protein